MKPTFFSRHALLILCIVFFLIPFALRGARMALARMENNVKDWLPADFPETEVLTWFGDHFAGEEAFVLMTFEGCKEGDESFHSFVKKLRNEIRLTEEESIAKVEALVAAGELSEAEAAKRLEVHRVRRELGDELGLHASDEYFENWGGLEEKWLLGADDQTWYYVTPDGELYKWLGKQTATGWLQRSIERAFKGKHVKGKWVAQVGDEPTATSRNRFHNDPQRLMERMVLSVRTGPDILEDMAQELRPRATDMSDEEIDKIGHVKAMERLKGWLYGDDEEQTCIVVTLPVAASEDFRRVLGRGILGKAPGRLVALAEQSGIVPPPKPPMTPWGVEEDPPGKVLRMGGPPVDNVAVDEEGQITLVRLVGYCAAIGVILAYLAFRSVKVTMMIFVVGGVSAIASVGIVWWTGSSVDAIMMSMPSLVYVLGLSGAVHIINYYRDACEEDGPETAPGRALGHGWWPCSLAAFTTSLGMLSLYASNIIPIKKFGLYSALGVMATLVMLFFYLPAALEMFPPGYKRRTSNDKARSKSLSDYVSDAWEMVGRVVLRRYWIVSTVCTGVIIFFAIGLFKIDTSVQLLELFDEDAKIIRDYKYLENRLGKLVPMELIVRFRKDKIMPATRQGLTEEQLREVAYQYQIVDRVEVIESIQRAVVSELGPEGSGEVGRGMSVATFIPPVPDANTSSGPSSVRGIINTSLNNNYERLLEEPYLKIDPTGPTFSESDNPEYVKKWADSELWRISIRIAALSDVDGDGEPDIDYGDFVSELEAVVEPVVKACNVTEDVLRTIAEGNESGTYNNSAILVLGAGNPTQLQTVEEESGETKRVRKEDGAERTTDNFVTTMNRILLAKGYRVGRSAKKMSWHDASEGSFKFSEATDEKLSSLLESRCVVLIRDHSEYDVAKLKKYAKHFIDARDHHFDPKAEGALTAHELQEPVNVVYTGVVPIVYKAQNTLLTSLITSTFYAFLLIMFVMMMLLGSWEGFHLFKPATWQPLAKVNVLGGAFSMFPNVFPVVLIFGAMGHLGIKVDIGTMMTASVAMGVAVDDTIHFLNWFRTGIMQGKTRREAILLAYRRCATAMTQTTLIGGLGLAVFMFSTFTPTQRFGTMMLTLLAAALVGDLIFLPALLASPIGRWFCPKTAAGDERSEDVGDQSDPSVNSQDAEKNGSGNGAVKTPHSSRKGRRESVSHRKDDPHR